MILVAFTNKERGRSPEGMTTLCRNEVLGLKYDQNKAQKRRQTNRRRTKKKSRRKLSDKISILELKTSLKLRKESIW